MGVGKEVLGLGDYVVGYVGGGAGIRDRCGAVCGIALGVEGVKTPHEMVQGSGIGGDIRMV